METKNIEKKLCVFLLQSCKKDLQMYFGRVNRYKLLQIIEMKRKGEGPLVLWT